MSGNEGNEDFYFWREFCFINNFKVKVFNFILKLV